MTGNDGRRPIRRALISVYDKTGLAELASGLHEAGVAIVSTGSTAKTIAGAGVPVIPVEELTGFPEVLDGRVKTLHPRVHAGLLADLRKPEHAAALEELGIAAFDLVVVNLYPFSETVASGADVDECVEQIDIGGPSMVRAAAKNHPSVAVVVDPLGYDGVLAAVRAGGFTLAERKILASLAFRHTAEYDVAVASWMGETLAPEEPAQKLPAWFGGTWRRTGVLRYGENPHQQAALYSDDSAWPGLAQAEQLHGKEMSYNNFTDADAAWRAAFDHEQTCVAIIKHANPCGIAISSVSVADAHRKAHECDPLSAFGGVIAANTAVSVEMAETVADIFTEVIIAPAYEDGAVEVLARKKNIRVLVASEPLIGGIEMRPISGGLLLQQRDALDAPGDDSANWTLATGEPADPATLADLVFAWRACRAVKSNAIVIAANGATVGVGMGQVNRVDAARLAVERGGDRVRGAVAASDAFFPFPDGLETLANAGVKAIVHPGGSMRDDIVTEARQGSLSDALRHRGAPLRPLIGCRHGDSSASGGCGAGGHGDRAGHRLYSDRRWTPASSPHPISAKRLCGASACTSVDAPMTKVPGHVDDEPVMKIPQPAGWARVTMMDSELIRFTMRNTSLAKDNSRRLLSSHSKVIRVSPIPERCSTPSTRRCNPGVGATDVRITPERLCGLPAETIDYVTPPIGPIAPHPAGVVCAVMQTDDRTFALTLTVQSADPDNPTYKRDAETILTGFQMLPPSDS